MAPYTQDMPTPANDDFLVEKFSLRSTMNFRQFNDDNDNDERLLHYGKVIQTDEAQFQSVFWSTQVTGVSFIVENVPNSQESN